MTKIQKKKKHIKSSSKTITRKSKCVQEESRNTHVTHIHRLTRKFHKYRKPKSWLKLSCTWGFPHSSVGKSSACNTGDLGLIPGLGRSPGEGNENPLQYPCLVNPMDRGAWQTTVHGISRVGHYSTKSPLNYHPIHTSYSRFIFI